MQIELLRKWNYINDWYKINHEKVYGSDYYNNSAFVSNSFAPPATSNQISEIETLVESDLPDDLKTLLKTHNGEIGQNNSVFFEQRLLNTVEIKDQIEFGLSLRKPSNQYIKNPTRSNHLIAQIVEEVKSKLEKNKWIKMTFQGGDVGFGMPTVYFDDSDPSKRENLIIEHKQAAALINQLKEEEKETYNWDEIKFTVYQDGKVEAIRMNTDWNEAITAFPPATSKAIYFHPKWVPVFSDDAGNYIGVDLDPDKHGVWGQIIIYGRDVYENRKVANNLEDFFDKIIADLQKGADSVILKDTRYHIHERLKILL